MERRRHATCGSRRAGVVVLLAAAGCLSAATARADVVTGPPEEPDCPNGSRAASCGYGHGYDHCAPRTCVVGETCDEGELCQDVDFCVTSVDCGWEADSGVPTTEPSVEAECDEDGSCSTGSCETLRVCMTEPVFGDADSCACSAARPGRAGSALGLGLAVAAAFALWRRRRGGR